MRNGPKQSSWHRIKARIIATPDWKLLLVVYFVFSAARFILALATTISPSIYPDEPLYINLAKGIVNQGQTLFNAQRINYIFLLYSLLISPLYLITDTVDVFRTIQALNSLMMTLTVFPVFALGKQMTGSRAKAWAAVMFILLLPDMALSRFVLEENLAYPAQFASFLFIYKSLKDDAKAGTLATAIILCVLLPFIKPYLLAVGGAFCLALCIKAFMARTRKMALRAIICSSILLLAVFFLYKAFLAFFTQSTGSETVFYVSNIKLPSLAQVFNTFKASSLYLYFFTVACCVLPVLVPIGRIGKLSKKNRDFMFFALAAWVVTILGSSYTISLNEMSGDFLSGRVHLRYIDAYLLLFIIFSMGSELNSLRVNLPLGIFLGVMMAGHVFLGASSSTSSDGNILDILPLAVFIDNVWMKNPKALLQALLISGTVIATFAIVSRGWTSTVRRVTLSLLALSFLLNNAAGYHTKLETTSELARDALEIGRAVQSEPAVIVAKNGEIGTDETTALDAYLRQSVPVIQLDDLLYSQNSNGAYRPIMPAKTKAEAIVTKPTPSSAWLVMMAGSLGFMELLSDTACRISTGGLCAAVWVNEGTPWLRYALAGHTNGILENDGTILIYDSRLVSSGRVRLDLKLQSKSAGNIVTIFSGVETLHVEVGISTMPASLDIRVPAGPMPVRIDIGCKTSALRVLELHLQASD